MTDISEQDLNLFNDTLRQRMVHEGEFMVSLAKVEGKTVLRPVICNPTIDSESLIRFVDKIIQIASTMN